MNAAADNEEGSLREAVRRLLQMRFGPLSDVTRQRLMVYPAAKLAALVEAAASAPSLKHLNLED